NCGSQVLRHAKNPRSAQARFWCGCNGDGNVDRDVRKRSNQNRNSDIHRQEVISVQHLVKTFGAQRAVDDLSFDIGKGEIVGFLGPNGAGKSTTLKMLTGMFEPTSGSATIAGFDIRRQILDVKRNVGFVPESGAVFESLTGLEYLTMVAALYSIPEDA